MPPVRHNMIPGMRAYHVVNRGIQACGEGILGPSLPIVTSKCRTIFVHAIDTALICPLVCFKSD